MRMSSLLVFIDGWRFVHFLWSVLLAFGWFFGPGGIQESRDSFRDVWFSLLFAVPLCGLMDPRRPGHGCVSNFCVDPTHRESRGMASSWFPTGRSRHERVGGAVMRPSRDGWPSLGRRTRPILTCLPRYNLVLHVTAVDMGVGVQSGGLGFMGYKDRLVGLACGKDRRLTYAFFLSLSIYS